MINPIGNKGPNDAVRSGEEIADAKKLASAEAQKKALAARRPAGDKVEISALAKDMQTVRAHLSDQDAARETKVKELQEQVQKGTYAINTLALAQKMYDNDFQGKG